MLQFLTVTKKYSSDISALEQVSFDINEGEFVFLVGPSGSGKTTIIRLLIREELPSVGKIFFDNEDITRYNRSKIYRLRRKIGVIFQDFKLIPEMTAFENIAFAMEAAGRSEKEIKENVPYLLDIVGLSNRSKSFPGQLSGGEKQRVAIARAMANNPKLLIADEPTGNLDPDSAWDIVQILSKINNWGTTVVMSTHGSDIVNTLHKRVLRLENGALVRDDFKGGYNKVDEFSLKILTAQSQSQNPKKPDISEKAEIDIDESQIKAEKEAQPEEAKPEPISPKATKLTQTKKTKKITFSTKKSKKEETVEPEKDFAEKMLTTVAKDIEDEEVSETPISDIECAEDLKKKLGDQAIITVKDLKDNFDKKVKSNKDFSAAEVAELTKFLS
jgi:cell division transport system ATP-binding protein